MPILDVSPVYEALMQGAPKVSFLKSNTFPKTNLEA
jgi:hypothetical protein